MRISRLLFSLLGSTFLMAQDKAPPVAPAVPPAFDPAPPSILAVWFFMAVVLGGLWPALTLLRKRDLDFGLILEDGGLLVAGPAILCGTFAEALVKGWPREPLDQNAFICVIVICAVVVVILAGPEMGDLLDLRLQPSSARKQEDLATKAKIGACMFSFCVVVSACITAAIYASHQHQ